jgi:hypothetical protein
MQDLVRTGSTRTAARLQPPVGAARTLRSAPTLCDAVLCSQASRTRRLCPSTRAHVGAAACRSSAPPPHPHRAAWEPRTGALDSRRATPAPPHPRARAAATHKQVARATPIRRCRVRFTAPSHRSSRAATEPPPDPGCGRFNQVTGRPDLGPESLRRRADGPAAGLGFGWARAPEG